MSGNQQDKADGGKVTSLKDWQERRRGKENIELLVEKMRRLRAATPVNEDLRRQLREKLVGHLAGQGVTAGPPFREWLAAGGAAGAAGEQGAAVNCAGPGGTSGVRPAPGRRWPWLAALGLLLLLAAGLLYYRQLPRQLVVTGRQEMAGFGTAGQEAGLQLAVPRAAEYWLAAGNGRLLLMDRQGGQRAVLGQPGEQYSCPAISPDGLYLAVAHTAAGRETEICLVELPQFTDWSGFSAALLERLHSARRLNVPAEAGQLVNIYWAPQGPKLVFTGLKMGERAVSQGLKGGEIYITSWQEQAGGGFQQQTRFLTEGRAAGWSPDGNWLLITRVQDREEEIYLRPNPWLFSQGESREVLLGRGGQPLWLKSGYLLFVRPVRQERVLSYAPDGLPGLVLEQQAEELCWVRPDEDISPAAAGSQPGFLKRATVLLPADGGVPPAALEWVQRMEARGIQRARLSLPPEHSFQVLAEGEYKNNRQAIYGVLVQQQRQAICRLELAERSGEEEKNGQK